MDRLQHSGAPLLGLIVLCLFFGGCASTYKTPGAGVNVAKLEAADYDIKELMSRQPAAPFPSRLSVTRAQAQGYWSSGARCYGTGRFCIVVASDVATDEDIARLRKLPKVTAVAVLSSILLPQEFNGIRDLRLAAASLQTDLLLVYSIDTQFNVDSTDIGPLALISLGFIPNKKAHVASTASAALFDVRTGFVYGAVDASASESQRATTWSSEEAIESARHKAEGEAFRRMLDEFEKLWRGVIAEQAHGGATGGSLRSAPNAEITPQAGH